MRARLRALARRFLPAPVRRGLAAGLRLLPQPDYAAMSRQEVFSTIYRRGAWGVGGVGESRFYSGPGSDDWFAGPYADVVKGLQQRFGIGTVLDLGCGDFRVGGRFAPSFQRYTGVDIVPGLIEHNRQRFGGENVSFHARDICRDELPDAELCLVRQVLQHLTNADILMLLPKLSHYRFVVVTEHLPGTVRAANLDKPPGPGVRVPLGSGVILHEAPFGWPQGEEIASQAPRSAQWGDGERVVSTLYRFDPQP